MEHSNRVWRVGQGCLKSKHPNLVHASFNGLADVLCQAFLVRDEVDRCQVLQVRAQLYLEQHLIRQRRAHADSFEALCALAARRQVLGAVAACRKDARLRVPRVREHC